jgi:hypothetical protein
MGWAYLTQEEAQRTIEPNTLNIEEGRPFVKMSANCDVVGTWRTRT